VAANEQSLGLLHEKVTQVLSEALDGDELPGYTEETADGETVEVPPRRLPPSAAIIAAATKFLKDNNITCAPAEDNVMGGLLQKLKDKQKARMSGQVLRDAVDDMTFLDRNLN
jgi:hypothetical protein